MPNIAKNSQVSSLISKRKARVDAMLAKVPLSAKGLFLRVFSGTGNSRSQAIKARCIQCAGFENVRDEVGNCTVYDCALWQFRPYQRGDE